LLYPLVMAVLHKDDLSRDQFSGSIDMLLELAAAYCLGEIELQLQIPASPATGSGGRNGL
jgi:hypothetical protein